MKLLRKSLAAIGMIIAAAAILAIPAQADEPPPVRREFRGAWIATVANIDWPSKPGLTVDEQKAELIKLLETASRMADDADLKAFAGRLLPTLRKNLAHFEVGLEDENAIGGPPGPRNAAPGGRLLMTSKSASSLASAG